MSDDKEPKPNVRIRTAATDKRKALDHYQDLRRSGKSVRAVVISEAADGSYTVLGQMLKPHEIAELLLVAAKALEQADSERTILKLEVREEPERRGVHNRSKPREPKITKDPDGVLVPPPGENFVSCGECNHPRWYVLHSDATDQTSRYACAACGNEVENIPIHHAEGRA
jgi:hypothetical protein